MDHEEYDHHHAMLAERAPGARCPMCGSVEWERTAVVAVVLSERTLGGSAPDDGSGTVERRRAAVALACAQCHFLRMHLTTSPYVHTEG
jgi:hypothetical protein